MHRLRSVDYSDALLSLSKVQARTELGGMNPEILLGAGGVDFCLLLVGFILWPSNFVFVVSLGCMYLTRLQHSSDPMINRITSSGCLMKVTSSLQLKIQGMHVMLEVL